MPNQIEIPEWLHSILTQVIDLNDETIILLIETVGEERVQRHALQTAWIIQKNPGAINNPPGWFMMSLRENWNPPRSMPADWRPRVITFNFRLDDGSFLQIEKEVTEQLIPIHKEMHE